MGLFHSFTMLFFLRSQKVPGVCPACANVLAPTLAPQPPQRMALCRSSAVARCPAASATALPGAAALPATVGISGRPAKHVEKTREIAMKTMKTWDLHGFIHGFTVKHEGIYRFTLKIGVDSCFSILVLNAWLCNVDHFLRGTFWKFQFPSSWVPIQLHLRSSSTSSVDRSSPSAPRATGHASPGCLWRRCNCHRPGSTDPGTTPATRCHHNEVEPSHEP